jgi:hypothetical protein
MIKETDNNEFKTFFESNMRLLYEISVDQLFPIKFNHYLKIFNPFLIDPDLSKIRDEFQQFDTEKMIESFFSWESMYERPYEEYLRLPVKHTIELMKVEYSLPIEYGIDFKADNISNHFGRSQPKWLLYPESGTVEAELLKEIVETIKPISRGDCFFHFDLIAIDTYKNTIFKGELEDLNTLEIGFKGTPTDIWDETKRWFIHICYDTDYLFLGADKDIIERFLMNPKIESLVFPKERLIIK